MPCGGTNDDNGCPRWTLTNTCLVRNSLTHDSLQLGSWFHLVRIPVYISWILIGLVHRFSVPVSGFVFSVLSHSPF